MRSISLWLTLSVFSTMACDRISVGDLGDAAADAGGTLSDGSSSDPKQDATEPGLDATPPGPDAGMPGIDAGQPMVDAGQPMSDASTGTDGSMTRPDANAGGNDVRVDGTASCANDLKTFLPLTTPANCPLESPQGRCDLPENSICVYQDTNGFNSCGCYAVVDGSMWKCWGASSGSTTCPLTAPVHGSTCAGQPDGDYCVYPFQNCSCIGSTWRCSAETFFAPREVLRACPPEGVDESKLVKDLTDEEVRAWCQWYGDPTHRPRPPVSPNSPEDTNQYATMGMTDLFGGGLNGCIPDLPVELCVRNLRYQACDASLRQLDDCIESARTGGVNGIVGLGCGPYFRNSTCDKTIIARHTSPFGPNNDCSLPLK